LLRFFGIQKILEPEWIGYTGAVPSATFPLDHIDVGDRSDTGLTDPAISAKRSTNTNERWQ
jgi:hypothetical protein